MNLTPGSYALLSFEISDLEINGIPKSFVEEPETMLVYSRQCEVGEE